MDARCTEAAESPASLSKPRIPVAAVTIPTNPKSFGIRSRAGPSLSPSAVQNSPPAPLRKRSPVRCPPLQILVGDIAQRSFSGAACYPATRERLKPTPLLLSQGNYSSHVCHSTWGMVYAACHLAAGTGQKLRFCNGLRAFAFRTETALCPRFLEWTISLRYSRVERSSSHARRTSSIQAYFQEKRVTEVCRQVNVSPRGASGTK